MGYLCKMIGIGKLTVFPFLLLSFTLGQSAEPDSGCTYPMFLRRGKHPWVHRAKTLPGIALNKTWTSYEEWSIIEEGAVIQVINRKFHPSETSSFLRTLTCIEQLEEDLYLVRDNMADSLERLLCMKFEQKSFYVVQISASLREFTEFTGTECPDNMMAKDPWLLLYYHNHVLSELPVKDYIKPCPLEGGYDVHLDIGGQAPFCQDFTLLRLESECSVGGGLVFSSTSHSCSFGRGLEQHFYCITSWKDGKFTYMVARPKFLMYPRMQFICVRLQKSGSKGKVRAIIYTDLICSHNKPGTYEESHFKLLLRNWQISSPCSDRSPECTRFSRKQCSASIKKICVKTCGFCPPYRKWTAYRLQKKYQGNWLKRIYDGEQEIININEGRVTIPHVGSADVVGQSECLHKWITRPENEYLGVITYQNGCAPRLIGLLMTVMNHSVLSIRLSQPTILQHNPFADNVFFLWPYWCTQLLYGLDYDNPGQGDKLWPVKESWYNLVKITPQMNETSTRCNLPSGLDYAAVRVEISENWLSHSCNAVIRSYNAKSFIVKMAKCTKPGEPPKRNTLHQCKAAFQDTKQNYYIVTRVLGWPEKQADYQCWMFPGQSGLGDQQVTAYIFPAGNCDPGSLRRVDYPPLGVVRKLASIRTLPVLPTVPEGELSSASPVEDHEAVKSSESSALNLRMSSWYICVLYIVSATVCAFLRY